MNTTFAVRAAAAGVSGLLFAAGLQTARADDPATPAPVKAATTMVTEFPPIVPETGPFTANTDSFKQYQYPDWFRDAKLGIWSHWGPQSVPMEGDWYARRMYIQGDADYKDHLARYGPDCKVGYKDIIPLWKAEKWDPDALMALYKKAGARYFVAQAVHHDNFDNWNSRWHQWNSVNMGPHRDMVGDWGKAARALGLRFGVSEHLGASYTWFQPSHGSDKTGPFAGIPYDGANPLWADLYHTAAKPGDTGWYSKDADWQREWYARIGDVVDQYHPDLLYSDGAVPFGNDVGLGMIAHLYNESAKRNHGVADAVYNCKQDSKGMWVQDLERGMMAGIQPYPWQTDTSIGDWFYNKHWKYRSCEWVVHSLVDIVSKNGNLLINVVQKPDGTLDDEALKIVNELTAWTAVNGEGIFDTRPWIAYGEGKHKTKGGSFNEDHQYSADDIRFTAKGDKTLYAFSLGWPDDHQMLIRSLGDAPGVTGKVTKVSLLGFSGDLKWEMTKQGLGVQLPAAKPCDFAICLKIEGENMRGFRPDLTVPGGEPPVKADAAGNFTLAADEADLTGKLHTQTIGGQTNIGFWDKADDKAAWNIEFPAAGKYNLTAEYASTADSELSVDLGDQKHPVPVAATGSFGDFKTTDFGAIDVTKPGVQTLTIHPQSPAGWKPVNLRWIKLVKQSNP
jgi:alpha-L-fucosidase